MKSNGSAHTNYSAMSWHWTFADMHCGIIALEKEQKELLDELELLQRRIRTLEEENRILQQTLHSVHSNTLHPPSDAVPLDPWRGPPELAEPIGPPSSWRMLPNGRSCTGTPVQSENSMAPAVAQTTSQRDTCEEFTDSAMLTLQPQHEGLPSPVACHSVLKPHWRSKQPICIEPKACGGQNDKAAMLVDRSGFEIISWLDNHLSHERRELVKRHQILMDSVTQILTERSLEENENVTPKRSENEEFRTSQTSHTTEETDLRSPKRPSEPYLGCSVYTAQSSSAITQGNSDMSSKGKNVFERKSVKERKKKERIKTNSSFLASVVLSKKFEYCFAFVILLNVVLMAVESQYIGLGVGHDVGFYSFREPKEDVWPGAEDGLYMLDYAFGVLYTIELLLKVVGLQWSFFDRWNAFDALIVLVWYFDKALAAALAALFPVDLMIFRLLRLLRLLRLIRFAKTIAGFDQLLFMFCAIRNSLQMLCWTSLMLFSCQLIFALVLNQVLVGYFIIESDDVPLEHKVECFKYFGTFARSIFSMYELSLGNWPPIGRFLMDYVSEFFVVFILLYKATVGFALIAVINGCFIKETFKAVDNDDMLMILSKEREGKMHADKMKMLLDAADSSGDGMLSYDEFAAICQTSEVNAWLGAQGLDASDAGALFKLLDDGDGDLTIEEIVTGVKKLKGPARSLDFVYEANQVLRREEEILKSLHDIRQMMVNYNGMR